MTGTVGNPKSYQVHKRNLQFPACHVPIDYESSRACYLMFVDHERMSAGDPHHDHATCGGTTSGAAAQKQTDLMAEILRVAMSRQ